jgi:hypothetical protein
VAAAVAAAEGCCAAGLVACRIGGCIFVLSRGNLAGPSDAAAVELAAAAAAGDCGATC